MEMTKMASKCAAVLCAMAVIAPVAAVAAPASTAIFADKAIVASAASDKTGDQYCKVGDTFTLTETMGSLYLGNYSLSDFKFQWYYSDDQTFGSNYSVNWTKISGATNMSYSATMTSAMNGRHFLLEVTNTKTGEVHKDWFPMRTVNSIAVQTKIGTTSAKVSNGETWVAVPVLVSGCYKNQVTGLQMVVKGDTSVFDSAKYVDAIGLSGIDNYIASTGEFKVGYYKLPSAATVGSDKLLGTVYLRVKSGANYDGAKVSVDISELTLSADDTVGNLVYGTSPVTATISSVTKAENPSFTYAKGDGKVQLKWNAVSGIDGYGIMGYQNGTWKLLGKASKTATSYVLSGLKAGTSYKVAVCVMQNGEWNTDTSKAIYVTPNDAVAAAPSLTVKTTNTQFQCSWTKVSGATAYAVAVSKTGSGGWNQIAATNTSTTSYTSPAGGKTPTGSYYVAVAAKVNGKWNISNVVKVTIKG